MRLTPKRLAVILRRIRPEDAKAVAEEIKAVWGRRAVDFPINLNQALYLSELQQLLTKTQRPFLRRSKGIIRGPWPAYLAESAAILNALYEGPYVVRNAVFAIIKAKASLRNLIIRPKKVHVAVISKRSLLRAELSVAHSAAAESSNQPMMTTQEELCKDDLRTIVSSDQTSQEEIRVAGFDFLAQDENDAGIDDVGASLREILQSRMSRADETTTNSVEERTTDTAEEFTTNNVKESIPERAKVHPGQGCVLIAPKPMRATCQVTKARSSSTDASQKKSTQAHALRMLNSNQNVDDSTKGASSSKDNDERDSSLEDVLVVPKHSRGNVLSSKNSIRQGACIFNPRPGRSLLEKSADKSSECGLQDRENHELNVHL